MKIKTKIYFLGVVMAVAGAVLLDLRVWWTGTAISAIAAMTLMGNAFDCFDT